MPAWSRDTCVGLCALLPWSSCVVPWHVVAYLLGANPAGFLWFAVLWPDFGLARIFQEPVKAFSDHEKVRTHISGEPAAAVAE
jgi:hypothetical protein